MAVVLSKYPTVTVNGCQRNCHVVAAERALGRPLPAGAVVHHVDEDRRNYANTNLVILESRAEHNNLHRRLRVRRAGGDPWTQILCCVCHTPKDFNAFSNSVVRSLRGTACRECRRYRETPYTDDRRGPYKRGGN